MKLFGRRGVQKGQATTEMVLLFPLFMFFMFGIVKIFTLLLLQQKVELEAFYAARRWELQSHRNAQWQASFDDSTLVNAIKNQVKNDLGCNSAHGPAQFLGIFCGGVQLRVDHYQVWNQVTLTVPMAPWVIPGILKKTMPPFVVRKDVPNRDRPIGFNLPGI
jgi:TadE-like protein